MNFINSSSLNAIVRFYGVMEESPNTIKALPPDERRAVLIALKAITKNEITDELAKPFIKVMTTIDQFKKTDKEPEVKSFSIGSVKKWSENRKGRVSSQMIKNAFLDVEGQKESFEKAKAERLKKKENKLTLTESMLRGYERIKEAGAICETLLPILEQLNNKGVEDLFTFKQQIDTALENMIQLKSNINEKGEKFDQEKALIQGSIDVLKELQKLPTEVLENNSLKSKGIRKFMKWSGNSKSEFIKQHSHLGQLQIYYNAAEKERIGNVSDREIKNVKLKIADLKHEIQILKGEIKA